MRQRQHRQRLPVAPDLCAGYAQQRNVDSELCLYGWCRHCQDRFAECRLRCDLQRQCGGHRVADRADQRRGRRRIKRSRSHSRRMTAVPARLAAHEQPRRAAGRLEQHGRHILLQRLRQRQRVSATLELRTLGRGQRHIESDLHLHEQRGPSKVRLGEHRLPGDHG